MSAETLPGLKEAVNAIERKINDPGPGGNVSK
jgi:hypothetical protein